MLLTDLPATSPLLASCRKKHVVFMFSRHPLDHPFVGDRPYTVSESTVSNTELSEFFWSPPSSKERAQ